VAVVDRDLAKGDVLGRELRWGNRGTRHLFWIVVLATFVSCAAGPMTYVMRRSFDEERIRPYGVAGQGAVTGSAFLKTRGGEVRLGAGNSVVLIPVTDYTREYVEHRLLASPTALRIENIAPGLNVYVREKTADAQGGFRFEQIPRGDYFVASYISWLVSAETSSGGWGVAVAHLDSSETVDVVVTQRDRSAMADLLRRGQANAGITEVGPAGEYQVFLEGERAVWANAVEPLPNGMLRMELPGARSRTVSQAKVVRILDQSGGDWTAEVLKHGRSLPR
jgi:hypothetical protein